MKTLKVSACLGCLLIGIFTIGCGGDGIKRVPVKGKVTVGGSEPFKNGRVIFAPKGGDKKKGTIRSGGVGTTDDEGNFVMIHPTKKPGIEPGLYDVYFSLLLMPDGSEPPDQSGVNPKDWKSTAELGAVNFVPPDYASAQETKYPTTVPETGGTFEFNIPALKPKKK